MIPNIEQNISLLSTFPNRTSYSSSNDYASAVASWLSEQKAIYPELNTMIEELNAFVNSANTAVEDITRVEEIVNANVNYKGDWVAGSYSVGESVTHNGSDYLSKIDNNTDEPPSINWKSTATSTETLLTKTFADNEEYHIELTDAASVPNVAVTKEIPYTGVSTDYWDSSPALYEQESNKLEISSDIKIAETAVNTIINVLPDMDDNRHAIGSINGTNTLVIYYDNTLSKTMFTIYDIDGNVVKTPTEIYSAVPYALNCAEMPNGNVVMMHSARGQARFSIIDKDGNIVLLNAYCAAIATNYQSDSVAVFNNNRIAILYRGTDDKGYVKIYEADGTTVVSTKNIDYTADFKYGSIEVIGGTRAVITFNIAGATWYVSYILSDGAKGSSYDISSYITSGSFKLKIAPYTKTDTNYFMLGHDGKVSKFSIYGGYTGQATLTTSTDYPRSLGLALDDYGNHHVLYQYGSYRIPKYAVLNGFSVVSNTSLHSAYGSDFSMDVTAHRGGGTVAYSIAQDNLDLKNITIKGKYYEKDTYISAVTSAQGQINTDYWIDINSNTPIETLNNQTIHYALSNDGRTTWNVLKAGEGIRPIVRNNGGTWEFNSNATFADTTWVSAATNNEYQALSEAMSVEQNKMNRTQSLALTDDDEIELYSTLDLAVILYTDNIVETPQFKGFDINYDGNSEYQPCVLGTDYEWYTKDNTSIEFKSLDANNLKIRIL